MQVTEQQKQGNFFTKPLHFLFRWRSLPPYELLSYVIMFAAATMFAYGIHPYTPQVIKLVALTIATLYAGFFAALIWNDITDKDIDIIVHPSRPIPDGRIGPRKFFAIALVFSALTFLFALLTSPWCLILVGITALFVAFHNKYLKKIIKLPAYSEIFTPVQWLTVPLFGFFATWTALPPTGDINIIVPILGYISIHSQQLFSLLILILFTYFADDAHDVAEGICDVEGDRTLGVKTYATTFGEKTASTVSFTMFVVSGGLGFLLFLFTFLSWIFFIPFLGIWLYTLRYYYRLLRMRDEVQRKQLGKLIGRRGYNYLLGVYVLIFIDVLTQLLNAQLLHWF